MENYVNDTGTVRLNENVYEFTTSIMHVLVMNSEWKLRILNGKEYIFMTDRVIVRKFPFQMNT